MADFYSMEEAARVLGISLDELKKKIQSGDLRQVGGGSSPQFRKNDVDEYARRQGLGSDPDVQSELSLDDLDFNDIFLGQGETDLGAHTVGIDKAEVQAAINPAAEKPSSPAAKPGESDIQIVRVSPQGASDSDVRISPIAGKKGPSDSDVTLLSSESAELDLGDLSPLSGPRSKPGDTAVNTVELGSSGEIPLIDADSDFELSPSGVIDALQPESGSDFELTALDSSSEFDVPATQTASAADVSNTPAGSGVNLAKPNDSGIGLANFDADSIELAPIDDAPAAKAAPKAAPAPTPAPAKSPVKAPAAAKPSDTGVAAAASAFDDTDFELEDMSGDVVVGDKTVQIESNSDFELVEQSDELSLISEPQAAGGSAVRPVAAPKAKVADDASSEWDLGGTSGESEEVSAAPAATSKGKDAPAKAAPALMRNVSTDWGTPWVVGLGLSTVMMLLLCMVAFDLVKNLYEFRGETPVSSGLIKQVAGLLGGK